MERFIQLNLPRKSEKAEAESLPGPERKEPEVLGKRLHRFVKGAAHKAATEFGRNSAGIFCK